MTKRNTEKLWDGSVYLAPKLAKQAKAKKTALKRAEIKAWRNFFRKSDWLSLEDWTPPPKKLKTRIKLKRGT